MSSVGMGIQSPKFDRTMPAWPYSLATRKLLAWVRKAAVGHLLLESANPVQGHESDMNRRAQDFGTTNQTDVEFKLVQQTLELEINNNQRALKIIDKNPSLGKTHFAQGIPRNCLELFDCPLHHLLNNLPSRLDILRAVAIPWVSVLHPQSAERIQRGSKQGKFKVMLFSSWKVFPNAQGTVMAPAHCPERNTPRSRVSFRESLGDHTVTCWLYSPPTQTDTQSKKHVAACSWPLQLYNITILKHHHKYRCLLDYRRFEILKVPLTHGPPQVWKRMGFGGPNPRRNCTPFFFSCKDQFTV